MLYEKRYLTCWSRILSYLPHNLSVSSTFVLFWSHELFTPPDKALEVCGILKINTQISVWGKRKAPTKPTEFVTCLPLDEYNTAPQDGIMHYIPVEEYRHWYTPSLACLCLGGFSPHQTLCKQPACKRLTSLSLFLEATWENIYRQ